jgi:hypothetical protein
MQRSDLQCLQSAAAESADGDGLGIDPAVVRTAVVLVLRQRPVERREQIGGGVGGFGSFPGSLAAAASIRRSTTP